jgi:hypothetical protein
MAQERYIVIDLLGAPVGYYNDAKDADLFAAEHPGFEVVDTQEHCKQPMNLFLSQGGLVK